MRLNAVKILKISITNTPKNKILEEIQKYLSQSSKKPVKPLKIFTPNTEQLVLAAKNPRFADVLNRADVAIPDTVGVVWAGSILTKNGPEKPIPGVEFMEDLVSLAVNRHVSIGLIGGRGNLAVDTLNCLRQKHPGLTGWAVDGPEIIVSDDGIEYSPADVDRLCDRIDKTKTDIVFVALGPPKQEYFIEKLSYQFSVISKTDHRSQNTDHSGVVFMAVGGSFDIISGRLPRAPVFMRKMGFEWLWRLILEPWRISRQLALVEFVWMTIRERLSGRPR